MTPTTPAPRPAEAELDLMTREEAEAAVASIHGSAKSVRALLRDLERRRGWQSMGFRSFDAFLEAEFDWSPGYAHRQIRAAEVEENLTLPIGSLREAQARELSPLPAEVQRAVWEVVKEGDTARLTARRIREVAAEVRAPAPELPGTNGEEVPPAEVAGTCAACGKWFTERLEGSQPARATCPRCRKRQETGAKPAITNSPGGDASGQPGEPAAPPHPYAPLGSPSPAWREEQERGQAEALPYRREVWEGGTQGPTQKPPQPAEKRALAPPLAHGGAEPISAAPEPTSPPPTVRDCLAAADDARRTLADYSTPGPLQEERDVDPVPFDPFAAGRASKDNPDWLAEHGVTLAGALSIARTVIDAAGRVEGGLPRLIKVLSQPGFISWMNRHGRKQGG